jgi:hypothetical protein
MDKSLLSKYTLSIVGGIVGGVITYLFRPSSFMVGQLPFIHVISRGKTLKGLDQILIPIAETSFNYLLAGIIIGAISGYLIKFITAKNK